MRGLKDGEATLGRGMDWMQQMLLHQAFCGFPWPQHDPRHDRKVDRHPDLHRDALARDFSFAAHNFGDLPRQRAVTSDLTILMHVIIHYIDKNTRREKMFQNAFGSLLHL